jgi:predicted permease
MSELFQLGLFSSKAVATVILVALAGTFLVRFKFLKDESLSTLSQCVFAMMLPCLLFSKVAEKVDLDALGRYWAIPASCIVFVLLGLLLGLIAAWLLKYPQEFMRPGIVASSFGNISFIPIPLITAMTAIFPVFAARPNATAQGISYVSLYLLVYSPMLWTIGLSLLSAKRSEGTVKLGDLLNPPVIGLLCGILVGTCPSLKGLFIGQSAPLEPFFTAAEIVGNAAVPCATIVLGGKLAYGPAHCELPLRTILGVSFVKLLILPSCALGLVWLAVRSGIMPRDPLLCVILVIEAAVPQATNLSVICALQNKTIEKDMACLLFWNYLAAIPVLAAFIVATMWLFS